MNHLKTLLEDKVLEGGIMSAVLENNETNAFRIEWFQVLEQAS